MASLRSDAIPPNFARVALPLISVRTGHKATCQRNENSLYFLISNIHIIPLLDKQTTYIQFITNLQEIQSHFGCTNNAILRKQICARYFESSFWHRYGAFIIIINEYMSVDLYTEYSINLLLSLQLIVESK